MLPFYVRGVAPGSVVRLESTYAMFKVPKVDDSAGTLTSVLTASYKVAPWIAPLARVGLVHSSVGDKSGMGISNVGVGAMLGTKLAPSLRLGALVLFTVPIGSGAGNSPNADTKMAIGNASPARYVFDSSIYATNDQVAIGGLDFAFIQSGLTAQFEATVFQFTRVRGDQVQKDSSRTLMTEALFLGYFIIPELSVGAEFRHSHWLSTPAAVEKDSKTRNNVSGGIGLRGHFKLSKTVWFRPALAYHQAIDTPLRTSEYKYVQLDLPFAF